MAQSTSLTPEQRTARARLAALTRWSKENGKAQGELIQAGLRRKFLRQVDEEAAARGEVLTDLERVRRSDCAYRAHMARLSFLASKARAERKGGDAA